jgi:predicted CoA-substrate-specific enzyme activase
MAVAGIDVGAVTVSAVILDNGSIRGHSIMQSREEATVAARRALDEAATRAGLDPSQIRYVVATGCGRASVIFANRHSTEVVCQARGARFLFPSAGTVLNLGAETSRALRLGVGGRVEAFVTNDKCAAGSGLFLDSMSRLLRVPVSEMGRLALDAPEEAQVSSRCVVFAESEVISHIHRGLPVGPILAGLHKAVADRVLELLSRVGVKGEVVVTGGMAKNQAIIKELEARLGARLLVPDEPQIVGALGAALIAQEAPQNAPAR